MSNIDKINGKLEALQSILNGLLEAPALPLTASDIQAEITEELLALELAKSKAAAGDRPTRPGQTVRSLLDGTPGVTITGVKSTGNVEVMFVGGGFSGFIAASDLVVTDGK